MMRGKKLVGRKRSEGRVEVEREQEAHAMLLEQARLGLGLGLFHRHQEDVAFAPLLAQHRAHALHQRA